MAKFRKKPVIIDATQWFKNGDHPFDYVEDKSGFENGELKIFSRNFQFQNNWEGQIVGYFSRPDVPEPAPCKYCSKTMHDHGWIDTLEGGHIVCPGDWVITGVKGEHYPCKPDIFDVTYDLILEVFDDQ